MLKSLKNMAIVAMLGLSTLFAGTASASVLTTTIGAWAQAEVIREGDKDFYFFGSDLAPSTEIEVLSIGPALHILTVDFGSGGFQGLAYLDFVIAINGTSLNTAITSVGLDSDAVGVGGDSTLVTKDVYNWDTITYIGSLASITGSAPADLLTGTPSALGIHEVFSTSGITGTLFSASNSFTQDFGRGGEVPEPASCLIWAGLASVGFFASRRNRKA